MQAQAFEGALPGCEIHQSVLGSLFVLALSIEDFLVLLWHLAIPQILQPGT